MSGAMRKISTLFVLMATMLLLVIKILPHHHHTLYVPGVDKALTTLHFGTEHCEHAADDDHHDTSDGCHGNHLAYTACKDTEVYKITYNYDFSPALQPQYVEVRCEQVVVSLFSFYKIHKIPDTAFRVVSLRAPPTV